MTGGVVLAGLLETSTSNWLATAAVLASVLGASWLIRQVGRWARENYDPRGSTLEAVQALLIVALSVAATAAVLFIWRDLTQLEQLRRLFDPSTELLVRLLVVCFLFLGAWGATVFVERVIEVLFEEQEALTRHQREVGYHVAQLVLYLLAIVATVAVWGIDIGNVLLGAGFLSVVLGLAARQTLASVLAGFVLLIGRPFDLGDWVEVDDSEGIVTDVSLFNTELRTVNGEYVVIPNDQVTATSLTNRSRRGRLRVDVEVGVDYDTDLDEARELATETLRSLDNDVILDHPDPRTVLKRFGDSAVVLELRFWIDNPTAERRWTAQSTVITAIKEAFAEAGIGIPFPQRTLSGRAADGLQIQGQQRVVSSAEDGESQ